MKNKKSKKKQGVSKPKYTFGEDYFDMGGAVGKGRDGLVRHYIESPQETITESQIAMARAREKAENNGWAKGIGLLGNMAIQYGSSQMGGAAGAGAGLAIGATQFAANGGTVGKRRVEIEGEEVIETPDGKVAEAKGPSHENGGITIDLPEGTEIFSKRIKVAGKDMAKRKKARVKKELTLQKLLDKNKGDKVLKDSLSRTRRNNEIEEAKDQRLQEMISQLQRAAGEIYAYGTGKKGVPKYQNGTGIFGIQFDEFGNPIFNPQAQMSTAGIHNEFSHGRGSTATPGINPAANSSKFNYVQGDANLDGFNDEEQAKFSGGSPGADGEGSGFGNFMRGMGEGDAGFTAGDAVGIAGTLFSAFAPGKNTEANRAGDTPNINAFRDFGNDALDRIDEAKGYIDDQRKKALLDLETNRTRTTAANRRSAKSVQTLRNLDLAADVNANKAQGDIYDTFARQMMGMLTQQAGLENQQDQAVMSGEERRDLADRQDRDNYYTQKAQDIATKGQGIQQVGKMMNQIKFNNASEKAVNSLSEHGYTWDNGVIVDKNGTPATPAEQKKFAKSQGYDSFEAWVADNITTE